MGEIERLRGKWKEGCGEKERRKERRSKGEWEVGPWRGEAKASSLCRFAANLISGVLSYKTMLDR